jgi:uncharacterized protein (TIGR00730 family)
MAGFKRVIRKIGLKSISISRKALQVKPKKVLVLPKIHVRTLDVGKVLKQKNHFRVSIFGSARVQAGDKVYREVAELAEMIGMKGYDVITGGGPGLMEAANAGHSKGDKKGRADSIGLVIQLPWENSGNKYLEFQHRFHHFSKRLDTFLAMSDVMVVTKGGIGSLLELFYMWQHLQVGHVQYKPIILIGEMWEQLIAWMKKEILPQNLVSPQDFDFIYIAKNAKEAMSMVNKFHELGQSERNLRKIDCKKTRCVIPRKPVVKKVSKKS